MEYLNNHSTQSHPETAGKGCSLVELAIKQAGSAAVWLEVVALSLSDPVAADFSLGLDFAIAFVECVRWRAQVPEVE